MDWNRIDYFDCYEFDDPNYPGSGDCIDKSLLLNLVALRRVTGWKVLTHYSVGGAVDIDGSWGHSGNSLHLSNSGCKAVDFHFETNTPINIQLYYVMITGFAGIGVCPYWNNPGFHVDTRLIRRTSLWSSPAKRVYKYLL